MTMWIFLIKTNECYNMWFQNNKKNNKFYMEFVDFILSNPYFNDPSTVGARLEGPEFDSR